MATLQSSTFLQYTSYGMTTATTVPEAYGLHGPETPATASINVAFTLARANDPTALLQSDWATRQTTLADLNAKQHALVDLRHFGGRLRGRGDSAGRSRHAARRRDRQ